MGALQRLRNRNAVHGSVRFRMRPSQGQLRAPVAVAALLGRRARRLVRGARRREDFGRRHPARIGRRRDQAGGARRIVARGGVPLRRGAVVPPHGRGAGAALLLRAAAQHVDRTDIPPEPEGHSLIRAIDARPRPSAGHSHDRRHLAARIWRMGLRPAALPRPEAHDGRAARHGIQGPALGLPVRLDGAESRRPHRSSGGTA